MRCWTKKAAAKAMKTRSAMTSTTMCREALRGLPPSCVIAGVGGVVREVTHNVLRRKSAGGRIGSCQHLFWFALTDVTEEGKR